MLMVAVITGEVFIPVFYRMGISSTYEVRHNSRSFFHLPVITVCFLLCWKIWDLCVNRLLLWTTVSWR